jgi:hypothetical protein
VTLAHLRALAPGVDAVYVGVVPVPQTDGSVVHHAFLVTEGEPIDLGPDGRAVSPIPAARIIGLGRLLPLPIYQGAALAPIFPT